MSGMAVDDALPPAAGAASPAQSPQYVATLMAGGGAGSPTTTPMHSAASSPPDWVASPASSAAESPPGAAGAAAAAPAAWSTASEPGVELSSVELAVASQRAGRATLFAQPIARQKHEAPRADTEQAPAPRFGHTAVVDGDTMVIFAGRDARCFGDVWLFSFTSRKWWQMPQRQAECDRPMPRAGHTAVAWKGQMYVFGGVADHGGTGTHTLWLNDLWVLDLATYQWRQIKEKGMGIPGQNPRLPDRRKGHTAQVWRNAMYVFGGGQDDQTMHNDLWEFDFLNEKWTNCRYTAPDPESAAVVPQARMYHVSVVTPTGKLIVFGGRAQTTTGFLNDLFEVDLSGFACRKLEPSGTPPTHRMCSTAIYHNYTLAIFTGGSFAYLEDSHQLNLRTMEWSAIEDVSFGGRTRPTTVKWKNTVLTFGGCVHGNGYVNDFVEVELEPMTLLQCVMGYMQEFGLSNDTNVQQGLPDSVHDILRPAVTASAP